MIRHILRPVVVFSSWPIEKERRQNSETFLGFVMLVEFSRVALSRTHGERIKQICRNKLAAIYLLKRRVNQISIEGNKCRCGQLSEIPLNHKQHVPCYEDCAFAIDGA